MTGEAALQDVIVAELGARLGAAVCGSVLAQLGATVVVPECAGPASDKARCRTQLMAGKLSLGVDARSKDDGELLSALLRRADIVLTSSDLDPDRPRLQAAAADTIVCDLTAFGEDGPMSGTAFSDGQIQALSGILDTTGLDAGPPTPIRLPVVEFMTGVYAAASCLAALRARRRGGGGQAIDMALYDTAFAAMSTFLPRLLDGSGSQVGRVGNRHAMASPWNVFKAQDGWILVCAASDVQWRRICQLVGRPELAEDPRYLRVADRVARFTEVDGVLQDWVGTLTIARCLDALGRSGIPCGPVTPVEGCPREANLDHRGMVRRLPDPTGSATLFVAASPFRMSRNPGLSPERIPERDDDRARVAALVAQADDGPKRVAPPGDAALPLDGVRVLEIGHYTTAPLSARHLANLGAEVIKIEPPGGEAVRDWAPAKHGTGYFFTYTNADKRSLVLDLETPEGADALRALIARSDVLVENLKPGALAKRGFSADEIGRINPRLVYCAVSGFGQDSIYAGRPAYDTVIQAMSGIMDLTRAGDVPVKTGISSADLLGAEMAVVAILAALEARDRTGLGQAIDLSMQDVAAWTTLPLWNGADSLPRPAVVAAADGFVLVEREPETPDAAGLGEGAHAMSRAELAAALSRSGHRAAPVLSAREALESEQTRARSLVLRARDENGEDWPLLASPLRLKGSPPIVRQPMRRLGADTEAILAELGLQATAARMRETTAAL